MRDVINATPPPVVPLVSREEFLSRWDNGISDGAITSAEITTGGGLKEFAKDLDRLSVQDKQTINLHLNSPEDSSKLVSALRAHRTSRFGGDSKAEINGVARVIKLDSPRGYILLRETLGKLQSLGFVPSQLQPRLAVVDPQGFSHVRLQTPIFGEEVVAHFSPLGEFSVTGALPSTTHLPQEMLSGRNNFDYAATLALIINEFGAEPEQIDLKSTFVSTTEGLVPAYEITVSNFSRRDVNPDARIYKMSFLVSPQDLSIIDSWVRIDENNGWRQSPAGHHEAIDTDNGSSSPFVSGFPFAALNKLGPDFYNRMKTQPATMKLKEVVDSEGAEAKSCYLIHFSGGNDAVAYEYLLSQTGEVLRHGPKVVVHPPEANDVEPTTTSSVPVVTEPSAPAQSSVPVVTTIYDLAKVTAKASANDEVRDAGRVDLETSKQGDLYALRVDSETHDGIHTRDAGTQMRGTDATIVTKPNDKWNAEDTPVLRSAAAAHFAAVSTSDFFRSLGFNSIDMQGERIVSNVNIRENYANAYWDGETVNYGEGDGEYLGPLTTIDIGAHEITHGFTSRTANLIYRGESGGLNESFSDIGGFMVEYLASLKNPNVIPDWAVGEDTWTPNNGDPTDALRYMNQPTADGRSIDNAQSYFEGLDVHYSSGVGCNAFYQLACPDNEGKIPNSVSGLAVQDGIGAMSAAQIFFRALAFYMTPSTNFVEARAATIQAAEDLFGKDSKEVLKTKEAWHAVGVQ